MRQFSEFSLFRQWVECGVCLANMVSLFCLITSLCFLLLSKDCWEIRLLFTKGSAKNGSAPDTLRGSLESSVRKVLFFLVCLCDCLEINHEAWWTNILSEEWFDFSWRDKYSCCRSHQRFTPSTKILIKAYCYVSQLPLSLWVGL